MSEEPKWEPDRPLSTAPEAALLRRTLRFVFRNLFCLAGGLAGGVLLGLAAQQYLPVAYQAEGRFVVDEVPFLQTPAQNSPPTQSSTEDDLVQSLILGIPSSSMRSETAARLKVQEKQLCFEDISVRPLSLRHSELVANIRVNSVPNSRTGTIDVTSQSASFAARVANAVLDELGNYNLAQARLNALDLDRQLALARVESIQGQLVLSRQYLDFQEQQVAQLDEYVKQGLPLESFPQFVGDVTLNNLKTERLLNQADYAGLASSSSGGLELEKKKAQVSDINQGIEQQAQGLAEGQRTQLATARVQEQDLKTNLNELLQNIQQFNRDREKWVQSFGDIAVMKQMIASDTNDPLQSGSAIVVVNRAVPPERPKSPRLWLNLLAGVFAGSVAGLLLALIQTLLDDRLVSPNCVEALTNLPCVATTRRPGFLFRWKKPPSSPPPALPGFNPLRTRLLLTPPGAKMQIIGFTPARKRELASRTVADLAVMLARAGRQTLVVDLHFSRPRQFKLLGIKPRRGLADWMVSEEGIQDYVWQAERPELALLSCEPGKPPAEDLITRRPLAGVIPQLKNKWEFVLIDAPAIASCWNLMLALPAKNMVIITARRRQTRARQVVQTAVFAQNQNWNVAGVALQGC